MGKVTFNLFAALTFVFAIACQKSNKKNSNAAPPPTTADKNPPPVSGDIQQNKMYIGLWMREDLVNSNNRKSDFSAFATNEDQSFVAYTHSEQSKSRKRKKQREIIITDMLQLDFIGPYEARLRVSDKFIQQSRESGTSEREIQDLILHFEKDNVQTLIFSADGSYVIHRAVDHDGNQNPQVLEQKYVRINEEIYNQKSLEYVSSGRHHER